MKTCSDGMFSTYTSDSPCHPAVRGLDNKGIKVNFVTRTEGGYWSEAKRTVHITKISLVNVWRDIKYHAELRAYFNQRNWDVEKHGLIYTDESWIKQFRDELKNMGFSKAAVKGVDFSEQGMQGDNYVSLDVREQFIHEYALLFTFGNVFDRNGVFNLGS